MRFLTKVIAGLLLALSVAAASAWWFSLPDEPDGFYTPPAGLPAGAGRMVRSEPLARAVPAGARAWRILYTTTHADGSAGVASAIVALPGAPAEGPYPVIGWAHGTTGIARGCAPSMLDAPLAGMPAAGEALQRGWAIVASDYTGLGTAGPHPYLIGDAAARAVLDALRAARENEEWRLGESVVLWGHSQGGHGALWAGMRAPDYAPGLRIAGVAALAPASDLVALLEAGRATGFGKLVSSFVLMAYRDAYAEIADTPVPLTGRIVAADMARRCIVDRKAIWSIAAVKLLPREGLFPRPVGDGPLGRRLRENTPTQAIAAPLLLAQGEADDAVRVDVQRRYVAARCAAGQAVDYREYPGLDHMGLVGPGAPLIGDLLAWTEERFAGRPATDRCPSS